MKYCFVLFIALSSIASAQENTVKKFLWLEGNWHVKDKDIFERWKQVNDTVLAGVGYHHDEDGEEKVDEIIKLVVRNGDFFYIPLVPSQNKGKEVEFKVTSVKPNSFKAENPTHDFPQTVFYQLKSTQQLSAYIQGVERGKKKRVDYPFVPVK